MSSRTCWAGVGLASKVFVHEKKFLRNLSRGAYGAVFVLLLCCCTGPQPLSRPEITLSLPRPQLLPSSFPPPAHPPPSLFSQRENEQACPSDHPASCKIFRSSFSRPPTGDEIERTAQPLRCNRTVGDSAASTNLWRLLWSSRPVGLPTLPRGRRGRSAPFFLAAVGGPRTSTKRESHGGCGFMRTVTYSILEVFTGSAEVDPVSRRAPPRAFFVCLFACARARSGW